jgi:hypothetical protein
LREEAGVREPVECREGEVWGNVKQATFSVFEAER